MKNTLILLFILSALTESAQDQIFKKDNTKVDAKILEVNPTEIRYKLFTYQDGPTIVINKSDVALVIYQNGVHEVFNTPATPPEVQYLPDPREQARAERLQFEAERRKELKERFDEVTSTKQVVFFKFLEILNGGVGVSYLREFGKNRFNVYVPVSVGFVAPGASNLVLQSSEPNVENFKYSRKVIDVALGLNFQTNTKRVVTHFIGPLVGMSQFNGTYNYYDYGSNNYYGTPLVPHTFVANNYYFMLNNGFLFRMTRNFNVMIYAAVGFQQRVYISGDPAQYNLNNTSNNPYYNNPTSPFPFNAVKFGFDFGYRF